MVERRDFGLNRRALRLVEDLVDDAAALRVALSVGSLGERLIDTGAKVPGSIGAGLALARITMGGLADISLQDSALTPLWPWRVSVRSSQPVVACLCSQYAGWKLGRDAKDSYDGLGSGPARALAGLEPIFKLLGYSETAGQSVLVVESHTPPPASVVAEVARACRIDPLQLTIILVPTESLSGSVQVAARVLEVALSKAHQADFPLERIVEGLGSAPLPPPHPDHGVAMGRTNDALIYGGLVHLFVTGPAPDARRLAEHLPSTMSRDYGEPFREIFARVGGDFYGIDPHLFSPAAVIVTAIEGGETYRTGAIDAARLEASFA